MASRTGRRLFAVTARNQTGGGLLHALARFATVAVFLAFAGCHQPVRNPPPSVSYDGLPVSGPMIDAKRAGFNDCVDLDTVHIRCRRHGVMVGDAGPYEAAVDLAGSSGEGGFDQLTLWHDSDNNAVFKLTQALEASGWSRCLTGNGRTGDQAIYMRKGAPVRVSMDISYWSKRRVRLIPQWNQQEAHCTPA
ncbi:hypothetical protein [Polymorphobacter sp. PAMC 29334]|uniref:hypothetical protein n=1 Tax=Polymorphobacter sp. PAMC 29334 TaxID=2862331 RepID=UPI001D02A0B5|nr:hypothetical protein [Polymorphobacter sp. PAMC 29334]